MNKKDQPSHWLVGTWRSDKRRTIAAWGDYCPLSPPVRKVIEGELGRLVRSFAPKRAFSIYRGDTSSTPYRSLWQSRDTLVIVCGTKPQEEVEVITFETPNVYRVHTGRYVEYFRKVPKPNKAFNGRRAKRARR